MTHILFVLDYFPPHNGGSETVFMNIISRLLRDGYKITVLTSQYDKKLKKHETILPHEENTHISPDNNFNIHRTGRSRLSFIIRSLFVGMKVLRQNPDISLIHTSTYGGAMVGSLLGKISKKKVLLTVHEVFGKLRYLYKGNFKGFFFLLFEKLLFAFHYDFYHCVSLYTLNSLRLLYGIPDAQLYHIPNGVDTDFRDPKAVTEKEILHRKKTFQWENKFVLLYFGHSGFSKGIDYLIKALPTLLTKYPDLVMVFNLIHAQRDLNIKKRIEKIQHSFSGTTSHGKVHLFSGFPQKDLRSLVAACDAVIAPSLSEGFGSVHTETVAMGKPLITTFIGPLPEVLGGKVIFTRPQSAQAIVDAVAKLRNGDISLLPQKEFSREDTVEKIKQFSHVEKIDKML